MAIINQYVANTFFHQIKKKKNSEVNNKTNFLKETTFLNDLNLYLTAQQTILFKPELCIERVATWRDQFLWSRNCRTHF